LLQVRGESQREANRNKTRILEADYPKLWILTPTASEATLNGFRAILDESNPASFKLLKRAIAPPKKTKQKSHLFSD